MVASGDPVPPGATTSIQPRQLLKALPSVGCFHSVNVAVGGTDFDDVGIQSTFWSSTNGVGRESALGYIHEMTWNDSCAAAATSATLNTVCSPPITFVGAAAASAIYAKPSWQSGITPNGIAATDNHRYIPDISLFASDGPQSLSFYLFARRMLFPPATHPRAYRAERLQFWWRRWHLGSSPAFAAIMH